MVTYVGYQTAVDSVQVPPNGRDTIRVALTRDVVETPPVVVDGLQRRLPSGTLGRPELDASALARASARGTPDVLRSASRQVGVSLNRPLAEVNVQGGGGGEHVVHLDGVPVREPVSLGGLLSAFSPQALGRLTVHKAGFGAAEGSYTAGVLEARHDLSRAEAPHVQFRDLHGAVRQEITPFQQLSVSGYRGTTRLGTDVASAVPEGGSAASFSRRTATTGRTAPYRGATNGSPVAERAGVFSSGQAGTTPTPSSDSGRTRFWPMAPAPSPPPPTSASWRPTPERATRSQSGAHGRRWT